MERDAASEAAPRVHLRAELVRDPTPARRTWRSLRWWPIARTGLGLVLRRKVAWLFLALGLLNFVFLSSMVYFVAELAAELESRGIGRGPLRFAREFVFTGTGETYRDFIFTQNVVVMLLLSFAAPVLVGDDFRLRSVSFYLSKSVTRRDYFLGKLAAACVLSGSLTLLPAVVLFLEYALFSSSFEYFLESQGILWSIVAYGALVSFASGVVALGVAAWMERTIPTVAIWAGVFLFLPLLGEALRGLSRGPEGNVWAWALLDFWALLRWISNLMFGIEVEVYSERVPWALAVLAGWIAASLLLFWKKLNKAQAT